MAALPSCGWTTGPAAAESMGNLPSRRQLIRNSRQHKQWTWVYCPADSSRDAEYRALLEKALEGSDQQIRLYSCRTLPDSLLGQHPLAIMGPGIPPHWQNKLKEALSADFSKGSFQFNGQTFSSPNDVFKVMYYPSPWNTQWPINLFYANTDDALLKHLAQTYGDDWSEFFWSSWGYELSRDGQSMMMGFFQDTSWRIDPTAQFIFANDPVQLFAGDHINILTYNNKPQTDTLTQMARAAEARYARIKSFTAATADQKISWFIYPDVETKGMRLRDTKIAQAIPDKKTVHLVVNARFRGDWQGEDCRALLRNWLGEPKLAALELGLATWFAESWGEGRGWAYWASRLHQSGNMPSVADMLHNESFARESPLVMAPATAAWVDFLIAAWGRETFLARYASWQTPGAAELASLQQSWNRFLNEKYNFAQPSTRGFSDPKPFQKGFTFAHEGYRIFDGYSGHEVRPSLERLSSLGTNALAIVPYSFMPNAKQASHIPVVQQAGAENDEAVLHSFFEAEQMGFFTLLKPQIWIRGGWPGDVDMPDEASWDLFFDSYYRWMRHYALLSEIYRFDALCVGTEFTQATLKHPERWRQMIRKWRALYSGTLTYAANWGPEFEGISFWDELDYCGLNGYYPLSKSTDPSDEELQQGAEIFLERAEAVSKRFQKPIWLTEIGYRSVEKPWTGPHEEAKNRPLNDEHQRRCYDALFKALADEPWMTGMFCWKWPSYLGHDEDRGAGFNPINKPAEATLKHYFGKR